MGGDGAEIVASGYTSFAHYRNLRDDPGPIGAYADDSAILGGISHNIGEFNNNSIILGGDGNNIVEQSTSYGNIIILGGVSNVVNVRSSSKNNSILGGEENTIGTLLSAARMSDSAIIGGFNNVIEGTGGNNVIIGGDGNEVGGGSAFISNSVVIGGNGITATEDNTVYVPNLNIGTVGSGTSVNNLGIDSAGNVTSGITEHHDFFIKRTLVKSEILALTGTPIELISAPGPGKIIVPHQIHLLYKFSGTGYTASAPFSSMIIGQSGFTWMMNQLADFEKLDDWLNPGFLMVASGTPIYNQPLSVTTSGGGLTDPTDQAEGRIQIDVHYCIMDST